MNIALLIAGGRGTRFGADKPKQFVEINGKPILAYTLDVFQKAKSVDMIAVVCIAGWQDYVLNLKQKYGYIRLQYIIEGGESRFQSILNGIKFFTNKAQASDCIMIHDAVRPCVTTAIIDESFTVANKDGATLAVAPSFDTMYISENAKTIQGIYPREKLFRGQTPETLRYDIALKSYQIAEQRCLKINATSELLMKLHQPIRLTKGSQGNIKITTTDDVELFKALLYARNSN